MPEKTLLYVLLIPLLWFAPSFALAHAVSCGDFIAGTNGQKQFFFEFYTGRTGDTQNLTVSVGNPPNWQSVTVVLIQKKESAGFLAHKEIYEAAGRLRLEKNAGLMSGDAAWQIRANLPEIGLVLNGSADCIEYY